MGLKAIFSTGGRSITEPSRQGLQPLRLGGSQISREDVDVCLLSSRFIWEIFSINLKLNQVKWVG
jgi:hypothetical protein